MLRSSSTPLLGSLLSSCSDSPIHTLYETNTIRLTPVTFHQNLNKLPSHQSPSHLNLSCYCSPISPSIQSNGLRRAQSDGNLDLLDSSLCRSCGNLDDSAPSKKFPRKGSCSLLETIPSFSYSSFCGFEDQEENTYNEVDEEDEEEQEVQMNEKDRLLVMGTGVGPLSTLKMGSMTVDQENTNVVSKMHLAVGLGVGASVFGGYGHGGGDGYNKRIGPGGNSGDGADMEEYYRKMVEENPGNPLFLRNYAQFLHETKKDLQGAEEYYSRAILADPMDGELLSQYAKLVWERDRDHDRAKNYFDRATQVAPEDSHVHAAYASYLWEAEEDEDVHKPDDDVIRRTPPLLHKGAMVVANG
ncbi:hypothetical protein Droror1_Dr00003724 [Drosera rotundifolia]